MYVCVCEACVRLCVDERECARARVCVCIRVCVGRGGGMFLCHST